MNYVFLTLAFPLLLVACVSQQHSPESGPVRFKDGITQVQVKFDGHDDAVVGSKVSALNRNCTTKTFKDREKVSCLSKLVGIGQIVGINNQVATVEFKEAFVLPETEYEVLKGEVKK